MSLLTSHLASLPITTEFRFTTSRGPHHVRPVLPRRSYPVSADNCARVINARAQQKTPHRFDPAMMNSMCPGLRSSNVFSGTLQQGLSISMVYVSPGTPAKERMTMSTIDHGPVDATRYPVQFAVDYPDRPLSRLTTLLRLFMVIPIGIVLGLVSGPTASFAVEQTRLVVVSAGGMLFLPPLLLILFRHKYPRWWFDWNLELLRFSNRVNVYLALLRDEYPSTDEQQQVHLDIRYPNAPHELSRWLPLVKWLLAIPHYVVLFFLNIAAFIVIVISWFVILFTGRYPRSLFDFVVGVIRWNNRVTGYALLLVTDAYPPFQLRA